MMKCCARLQKVKVLTYLKSLDFTRTGFIHRPETFFETIGDLKHACNFDIYGDGDARRLGRLR
jgi:hypothetical protein